MRQIIGHTVMYSGASGLHLGKQESLQGGLEAVSVGDGLFCILSTLGQRASSPQLLLQPILTYMACGYMGRQVSIFCSSEWHTPSCGELWLKMVLCFMDFERKA